MYVYKNRKKITQTKDRVPCNLIQILQIISRGMQHASELWTLKYLEWLGLLRLCLNTLRNRPEAESVTI